MMRILLLVCASLMMSCGHVWVSPNDQAASQAERDAQEKELNKIEEVLAQEKYAEALAAFQAFQAEYPQSGFFMAARLGEAQALEGLGQWTQAVAIEREVSLITLKEQPEIAALALYRLSFTYREIGEDSKAAAALLDAQRLGNYLPMQITKVEIPARLAAFYASQGRDKEAASYLNDAEKGVEKVQQEKPEGLAKDWLPRAYYQMGSISINQLGAENFSEFIRGERVVQVYLLKVLKLNDSKWSPKALNYLNEMYRELDRLVVAETSHQNQIQMGGAFFDLIEGADLFRPLEGQRQTTYEKDFFAMLSLMRKKTEELLYSTRGGMELTEESKKLNSLKRAGRVKADSLLPHEKKSTISLPLKVVPTEDPNL
ncbi:hypothetical protein [Bdellovibrio sp. HCB2-146]|uniref:hypothetical protein n=1 Tax=Bdellovibrio sp. HCB2-146 TaxID=3394362 RepID=UPI0039BD6404